MKLKLGFAGFRHGHIFALYAAAKENPDVEIVGAWEGFAKAKQRAVDTAQVNFTHATFEDLINDPGINAIAVGGYFAARGQMAIDALKAGKHVIADKPLCTSLAQLDEIERLSKEKNLKVGLMLDMRYHKNAVAMKELVEKGELGQINCAYIAGQHPLNYGVRDEWYFEPGKHGGTINDISIHGVDLIRYITGQGIAKVESARCWNGFATEEPDFADCGQFMFTLENGAGVIGDVSYAVPSSFGFTLPDYWKCQFWGTKAMAVFSNGSDGVTIYKSGETEPRTIPGKAPASPYHLNDFIAEIEGKAGLLLNTAEALRSTRETLLVQAAADANCKKQVSTDKLAVKIYDNRRQMGAACATLAGEKLRAMLSENDEINVIFAAAPSQNEVLEALIHQEGIDWSRVNAMHMDEYIGISPDAPQAFSNFLRDRIFTKLPFKSVNYINGDAANIDDECARYSALLAKPIHAVFMGIGENGHIAFNDPGEADFNDTKLVKKVVLDEKCRQQQVNDGCFAKIDDVPKFALTLTIPALMKGQSLFCAVPAATKADAVRETVCGEITNACPASILRTHSDAIMFCDVDSAKDLL